MATFYLPIATPEMKDMMTRLAGGHDAKAALKHKAAYTIIECSDEGASKWFRRKLGDGKLRNVAPNEKLYVLLHGLVNTAHDPTGRIGAKRGAKPQQTHGGTRWVGGAMRAYTPQTFAEHLEAEELDYGFVDLRLFCCYSGAGSPQLNGHISFAQALKQEMRGLGFNNIMVTGYFGALSDGYDWGAWEPNRRGIRKHPDNDQFTATEHKIVRIRGQHGAIRAVASLNKQQF